MKRDFIYAWWFLAMFTAYLDSGFWTAVLNLVIPYYPIWVLAKILVKLVN